MKIRMRQKLPIAFSSIILTAVLLFTFIPAVVSATGESRPYLETDNTLAVNIHSAEPIQELPTDNPQIEEEKPKEPFTTKIENNKYVVNYNGELVYVGKGTDTFIPEITMYRWEQECFLRLYEPTINGMPLSQKNAGSILTENTIQWASKDLQFLFYPINIDSQSSYGSFEYEITLANNKAGTDQILNSITLPITSSGLKFYYQPPLTEEFNNGWSEEFQCDILVTETTVTNLKTGDVLVYRPENVVGSYAVYHATKSGHIIGQTNYKTGEAFHIYRPQLIDNVGDTAWADLIITDTTLTIDFSKIQDWLNTAKYPVTIDPNFGYETVGGTEANGSTDILLGSLTTGAAGTGISISWYVNLSSYDDGPIEFALYKDGDSTLVDYTSVINTPTPDDWNTANFTGSPPTEAIDYRLVHWGEEFALNYNDLDIAQKYQALDYPDDWPDPATFGEGPAERTYSAYCTYTVEGVVAPTVVTNAATSVEETTATLSGNITATGGANCTERGFEWDIDTGTPYADNWTEAGDFGTGVFTHGITSLTEGELYYYRASANNSAGWGYGSEVTFLTKPNPATSFASTDNGTSWISLGWTNGAGMDYVEVRYAEGSAPSDNVSGTLGYWGSGTSANVTGLNSGTTYFFAIFTHATEGGLWSSSDNNPTCQDTTDSIAVPTVTTANATLVEETTATLNGEITATGGDNATARRFEWGTNTGAYTDNWTEYGDYGTGNFTHGITALTKGEGYYYIASANNSAGWGAGSEVFFITKPDPATSFTSTDNGTTWISLSWINGTGMDYVEIRYAEGSAPSDNTSGTLGYWGSGTSANVTGLDSGTTYFFIIFTHATENSQWSTADDNPTCQDTTDSAVAPTVTSDNATSITYNSALFSGNITDTGGENADYIGFEWGTASGVYTDNWTEGGNFGVGNFTHTASGLSANTTYFWRAMAHNSGGWGYSAERSFDTLAAPPVPPALPRVPAIPLIQPIGEGMNLIMASCAVGLFSVFGFWRRNALLFMLAGGASLMVGLQWYNVFVTSTGLTIGLMLIAYALACLAFAFRYLFWRGTISEE